MKIQGLTEEVLFKMGVRVLLTSGTNEEIVMFISDINDQYTIDTMKMLREENPELRFKFSDDRWEEEYVQKMMQPRITDDMIKALSETIMMEPEVIRINTRQEVKYHQVDRKIKKTQVGVFIGKRPRVAHNKNLRSTLRRK